MLSIFLFSFYSVSAEKFGYGKTEEIPINYSTIPTVNSSNFWDGLDTPSDIFHHLLSNLAWSVAGHIMDADLDMDNNNINNVENITAQGTITANEFAFDGIRLRNLTKNEFISGSVFGLMMTNPDGAGVELPYLGIMSGGNEQASFLARSFMIVNEVEECLNNSNRTNPQCYADVGGFEWAIDFNTSTTGADLGITDDIQWQGDAYGYDTEGDLHFLSREFQLRDEKENNLLLTEINGTFNGTHLTIQTISGETIVVNIDKKETILNITNDTIAIPLGTNSTPAFTQVYYENKSNPTLATGTSLDLNVASVGTFYMGDGFIFGSSVGGGTSSSGTRKSILRAIDEGIIYTSGFDINVNSTEAGISTGSYKLIFDTFTTTQNHSTSGTSVEIHSDGDFHIHINNLSGYDTYGTGEDISVNKLFSVVCGVTHTHDSKGTYYCVVQDKPSTEHSGVTQAETDNTYINYYPNDAFIKKINLPLLRIVVQRKPSGNEIQQLSSGSYFFDLRGDIGGGGGSPPTPGVTTLSQLTIDTNLNMTNPITGVKQNITVGDYKQYQDASNNYIFKQLVSGTSRFAFMSNGDDAGATPLIVNNPNSSSQANTGLLFSTNGVSNWTGGISLQRDGSSSVASIRVLEGGSLTSTGTNAKFYVDGGEKQSKNIYDFLIGQNADGESGGIDFNDDDLILELDNTDQSTRFNRIVRDFNKSMIDTWYDYDAPVGDKAYIEIMGDGAYHKRVYNDGFSSVKYLISTLNFTNGVTTWNRGHNFEADIDSIGSNHWGGSDDYVDSNMWGYEDLTWVDPTDSNTNSGNKLASALTTSIGKTHSCISCMEPDGTTATCSALGPHYCKIKRTQE